MCVCVCVCVCACVCVCVSQSLSISLSSAHLNTSKGARLIKKKKCIKALLQLNAHNMQKLKRGKKMP